VQLGVFGNKENAERLVLQARVKGFKASVSPITSGKNKMYRVRVGPAADKPAAQELQTKLKAAGIAHSDAKVVPYS
jgi:cell division septation protein DedD